MLTENRLEEEVSNQLTERERQQILYEWNQTEKDFPDLCIHQVIEQQTLKTPDAIALIGGEKQLTYREFNQQANQLAHYLQSLGVKADTPVVLCLEKSLELMIAMLGVLKAGGAYVPVEPEYPKERIALILEDVQATILLTKENLLAEIPEINAQIICLDRDQSLFQGGNTENPQAQVTPDNLAYIIYTSGSTGKPKGVLIRHRGVVNHSWDIVNCFQLNNQDRALQFSTISFDLSVQDIYPTWFSGGALVLRNQEMLASAAEFIKFSEQHQLTYWNLPTAFWHELVRGFSLMNQALPEALRLVIVVGEKVSTKAYLTWKKLAGNERVRWVNGYGPTETTVISTYYEPGAETPAEIHIGRPIANTQIYLLNDQMQPVPVGVPGEMYIGGVGVARGYHNRPELNANRFVPNPFLPATEKYRTLYRTGDLARYLPDGNIEYIGRVDFQVKIRGYRIELSEIEKIIEEHPEVTQTVVLAPTDSTETKRIVAYIVPKKLASSLTTKLEEYLTEKLPEYMIPSAFVEMEKLPMTTNGKIDRKALPVPNFDRLETKDIVAPQNVIELQLSQIWQKTLGIKNIGITDNFFELGGHSLLAVRLLAEIKQTWDKTLPITTFLQAPTIQSQAKILQQAGLEETNSALVLLNDGGEGTPIFCIYGILLYQPFARHFNGERAVYGVYVPAEIELLKNNATEQDIAALSNVPYLATQYRQEIQKAQPQGPYYLAGESFGGIVALEIAQQLRSQGQEVALIGLFDTHAPTQEKMTSLERIICHLKNIQRDGGQHLWRKLGQKFQAPSSNVDNSPAALEILREKIINQATENYQARPYAGKIVLFRALDVSSFESYYTEPKKWQPFAPKNLEVYQLPGDHLGILKEPNVAALADYFKKCLLAVRG